MSASKSSPDAFLYILLFVILSAGALYLLKDYSGPESLPAQVDGPASALNAAGSLDKDDLDERIEGYRQFVIAGQLHGAFPPPRSISQLKEMGLADPVADLKADLQRHPELIPLEASLGGIMGFRYPAQIHVISSQWVLAYFEDGHTAGYALLKYSIGDGGKIAWKTVDAFHL